MTASSRFKPATRERLKLRLAIDGPSGSGKSVTALRFAHALAAAGGGRIAAINTEAGGLRLYQGERFDGDGPFQFADCALSSFAPTQYVSAINDAGREGFDVLVIDSLSHAWEGKDGALEQVNRSTSKNSFTAWKDVTPQHRAMVEAILQSPCHVIVTMRSKTEYVLEDGDGGKKVPRKIGVAPIQRAGMEYEFDLYCSMDWSHVMTVTKSRCRHVDGAIAVKPSGEFMRPVIEWLNGASPAAAPPAPRAVNLASTEQVQEIATLAAILGKPAGSDQLQKELIRHFSVGQPGDLRPDQANACLARLRAEVERKQKAAKPTVNASANGHAPSTPAADPTPTPAPTGGPIRAEQLAQLAELREQMFALDMPGADAARKTEVWKEIVGRKMNEATGHCCHSARELSQAQAADLILKMAHKINCKDMERAAAAGAPHHRETEAKQEEAASREPPF